MKRAWTIILPLILLALISGCCLTYDCARVYKIAFSAERRYRAKSFTFMTTRALAVSKPRRRGSPHRVKACITASFWTAEAANARDAVVSLDVSHDGVWPRLLIQFDGETVNAVLHKRTPTCIAPEKPKQLFESWDDPHLPSYEAIVAFSCI